MDFVTVRIAAYALLIGLCCGYLKGCTDEKDRGASFKASVSAIGAAQEKHTQEIIKAQKQQKEKIDEQNVKLHANYDKLSRQLHDARTSLLPSIGTASESRDGICFDRTELDRALSDYEDEVEELLGEGDKAIIDLNSVKSKHESAGAGG